MTGEVLVNVTDALLVTLISAGIVVCAVAVWVLVRAAGTLSSVKRLADDLDSTLIPLAEKADVTIDAINAELLRVDLIVTRVEEVTDRVTNTTHTVQDIVNAPAGMVSDVADRVRRVWKSRGT